MALGFFLLGTCLGSFLNVVSLRTLKGAAVTGRSRCPACHHQLAWWQMFPILSFMVIQGRCQYCGHAISVQYPIVELITGLATLLVLNPLPINLTVWTLALIKLLIIYILLVLAVIDARSFMLPDKYIVMVTGLTILTFLIWPPVSLTSAFWGMIIGSGFLFLLWVITRGRGIGLGDIKLMLPLGALLGWPDTILALWLAFTAGGLVGAWLLWQRTATLKSAIPFGPYLIGAAIFLLIAGGWFNPLQLFL